jgi:hypothetical protein
MKAIKPYEEKFKKCAVEMNVESQRQVFAECHPAEKRWQEKQC